MSRAEIIAMVDQTSPEDRIFLQAYVDHLARSADSESGSDLDRRLDAMRAGKEFCLDDVRRLHEFAGSR
jgi:hypothetical protein